MDDEEKNAYIQYLLAYVAITSGAVFDSVKKDASLDSVVAMAIGVSDAKSYAKPRSWGQVMVEISVLLNPAPKD